MIVISDKSIESFKDVAEHSVRSSVDMRTEFFQVATYKLKCTTGDIIIASGCIAYFGAFPSNYRRELEKKWVEQCQELEIPSSDTFE